MNAQGKSQLQRSCATALEEAGTWFALLHATDRKENIPRGFRRWLALSAENEAAFELVTHGWELSHRLPRQPLALPRRWQRAGFRAGFARAVVAVAAASIFVVVGIVAYLRHAGISTEVGEQRVVTLEDGTRISLNTGTRLQVRYDSQRRLVELRRGEAHFEVAREPGRPFVVAAADKRVTALGTTFVVRRDAQRLSITLMEGKIAVTPAEALVAAAGEASVQTLLPGQRITFVEDAPPSLDRPKLDQVVAWREGHVEMDRTPLASAALEMNRYSSIRLVVEGPAAGSAQVNGVFRAGDTLSFAHAMASTCGLRLVRKAQVLVLSGEPTQNCR